MSESLERRPQDLERIALLGLPEVAFEWGAYRFKMDGAGNPRLSWAILAIKRELVYTGFATGGVNVALPVYGDSVRVSVSLFQSAQGLPATGECDFATLRELFRTRVLAVEKRHSLPRGVLGRKLQLESAWDPAAQGTVDPHDRGVSQINAVAHPEVSDEEAYDPAFAIPWAGGYISQMKQEIEAALDTLKGARAGYNAGRKFGQEWVLAGFPSSGGPPLADGRDSFAVMTGYVAAVDRQTW